MGPNSGVCAEVDSLCTSQGATYYFLLASAPPNHIGSCSSSAVCNGFAYDGKRGFTDATDANSHCIKCIDATYSVKSSTFGSCAVVSSQCGANLYFKLSNSLNNDLGSCESSTVCGSFYYGTGNGYTQLSDAEAKCTTCQSST